MACEIQSADELVLTELIFNGVFSALSGEQIVALTSCFVWSEKSDVGVKVSTLSPLLLFPHQPELWDARGFEDSGF